MFTKKCMICSSSILEVFLDLGDQPWCNDFIMKNKVGSEKTYPLAVCFCHNCTTPQLTYTVSKETMYVDHLYLSGPTSTMKEHFSKIAKTALKFVGKTGQVLDIGSNDGTLLFEYKQLGCKVLGVDPCKNAANIAINNGIETAIDFFDENLADKILSEKGKFQVISAANVFYHIENLHGVTKGIAKLLDKDGVFVVHASYLPYMMEKNSFDIIYHEHLLYYRVENLANLLLMHGMEIFHVEIDDVHGGSLIAYACLSGTRKIEQSVLDMINLERQNKYDRFETYKAFGESLVLLKNKIYNFVSEIKSSGKSIFAFGAPAKGTVLLNYCGFSNKEIDCAVEKNPLKIGRYIPCTGIPIVDENNVNEPDYYLLLSWNFKQEFCKSKAFLNGKRKFIVPVPEPEIIGG